MGDSSKLTARQQLIDKYLKGLTNLYGLVEHRHFLKVFNRYNGEKLKKDELMECSFKLNRQTNDYYIYQNIITSKRISENELDIIYSNQQGKDYYFPTEKEIINYSDNNYYEKTPATDKMYHFFRSHKVSVLTVSQLIKDVAFAAITEQRFQTIFNIINKYGIEFSSDNELNALAKVLMELNNTTRKWANRGQRPDDMFKIEESKL